MADTNTQNLEDFAKKVEVLDSAAKVFAILSSQELHSGRWVFRGQNSAALPLQPSLERFAASIIDLPRVIEEHAIREFQRRAHQYVDDLPEMDNHLEWLSLMRHHGSPTRLLDFTKSPYVAAFFATAEAGKDVASAIWAIDACALKEHAAAVLEADRYASIRFSEIWKNRKREGWRASFSDPDVFKTLLRGIGAMPDIVAPVEPFRFNKRMVLQQGLFLCPFGVGMQSNFQSGLVRVLNQARSNAPDNPKILFKLVIEPSAHPHVLRELYRMNCNGSRSFPPKFSNCSPARFSFS